jgi:D-arabinose 1-dehydrogenase-like Zn-dependent alcohol dehydrogenase
MELNGRLHSDSRGAEYDAARVYATQTNEGQELLDFCAEHGVLAQIETTPIQQIHTAFDRMVKKRYQIPACDRT